MSKRIGKRFVGATAKLPLFRQTYELCGILGQHLVQVRGHARFSIEATSLDKQTEELSYQLFPDRTVLGGPFQGLKYPALRSSSSALLPKLLGSYESELHPTICELSRIPFDTVVDIGCAEGYYAIGAARLWNNATVYAFDIDPDARTACSTMAVLNGVADRVRIAGKCDPACLLSLPLGQRSLIIADCEGYERSLFSGPVVADLYKSDFIVEMHDFIDIEISAELKERFSQTHWVKSVYSVDDLQKVHQYKYPALDGLSKDKTRAVLSERRPGIMEWLIARSRIGSQ